MGRGRTSGINAIHALRHTGIQSDLLGPLSCRRILCRRVLPVCRDSGLAARWASGRNFEEHARHFMGVRALLCSYYGSELEISFYPTDCFLRLDYSMFNFGCVAYLEVGHIPTSSKTRI